MDGMLVHCKAASPYTFSLYTHEPLGECVCQETTIEKWDIPWYTMREHSITILYHAIENTVVNTINVTYAQHMMERLDVIPSNIQLLQLSYILNGYTFLCHGINSSIHQ